MSDSKRLFLIDAFSLIFRGYYALIKSPRINSKGMDTSAIFGFTSSLLDLIKRERPELLAVAFDKGRSRLRVECFQDYKAHRKETPEAIKMSIPYIQKILKAMNIPILEVEGFEADDLIGTIAKKAEKEGCEVYMVTPDKDYAQLVSEHIFMYKPTRIGSPIEIWDVEKVREKFGVKTPSQVIDFLGMMGDASDNIPGLPGVGEKTAKKFIQEYGSMENLLENTHKIKGKLRERVEQNKDIGQLSKKLATIILDCPVAYQEKDFKFSKPDAEKIDAIFQELEFRRLSIAFYKLFEIEKTFQIPVDQKVEIAIDEGPKRQLNLFGDLIENLEAKPYEIPPNEEKDSIVSSGVYQFLITRLSVDLFLSKLKKQKTVSFEILTEKDGFFDRIIGLSFSYQEDTGYYIAVEKEEEHRILEQFKSFFESTSIQKITYDVKYQIKILQIRGIRLKGSFFDIGLAYYLLDPDLNSKNYLYQMTNLDDTLGKKSKVPSSSTDFECDCLASCKKTERHFYLKDILQKKLSENELDALYENIELPLLKGLAKMELEGINLDTSYLKLMSKGFSENIASLERKIFSLAGREFNISSPRQLGYVLFEELKLIENSKKTKTGQYATGEEVLKNLKKKHKIVTKILKYRELLKLKNTYVDVLPREINPRTQRVHTTYNQTTTSTGRLSSVNPNLQNIPIRSKRGREIRKAFIRRDENYLLFTADYSQIELRLIAELSGDLQMCSSFQKGEDIHQITASKIFNIDLKDVTKRQRSQAKKVNFGIIYGISPFGLSQQTNLTKKAAKELIENYYNTYPRLKTYMIDQIEFAKKNGFVKTLSNRRRYLKNIHSKNAILRMAEERNAINTPIQGSASDIIKIAMVNIQKILDDGNFKTKMLLQVHDELIFDMHQSEVEELKPVIIHQMENAYKLDVPLTVAIYMGENWMQSY